VILGWDYSLIAANAGTALRLTVVERTLAERWEALALIWS
jgi:hypothetical protein